MRSTKSVFSTDVIVWVILGVALSGTFAYAKRLAPIRTSARMPNVPQNTLCRTFFDPNSVKSKQHKIYAALVLYSIVKSIGEDLARLPVMLPVMSTSLFRG